MKRSHAPIFWLLFGGGGMLAALFGTALVLVTGIVVPITGSDVLAYPRMLALAQSIVGKAFVLAVIVLFAWLPEVFPLPSRRATAHNDVLALLRPSRCQGK